MRRSTQKKSAPAPETPAAAPVVIDDKKPSVETIARIPHDTMNEQVLLGTAISDALARRKLVRLLAADGFYGRGHRPIWEGIVELEKRGLAVDAAALRSVVGDKIDPAYVEALARATPAAPANLAYYVECWLWDRRRVEAANGPINDLIDLLRKTTTDPDMIRRAARRVGAAFDGSSSLRFLRDPETVIAELEKDLDESVERRRRGHIVDHPYGLDGFDVKADGSPRLVPGMEPAGWTLLAGQSGHGKTTLVNQIILKQIARGRRVMHGAWEAKAKTNLRLLAGFSLGIPRARLRTGAVSDDEIAAIKQEARRLVADGERPMIRFLDLPFSSRGNKERNPRVLNDANLDIIHEHVEFAGCDVAIFDLFHQALSSGEPSEEKHALDRVREICEETNAHLVLVHHLNKEDLKARADQRPTRQAIKGGTHWINAPDTILAPHIPGKTKQIPQNTLEIHVLKQRDGEWPIAVEFDYEPTTGLVKNGRDFDMSTAEDGGTMGEWLRPGGGDEYQERRGRR